MIVNSYHLADTVAQQVFHSTLRNQSLSSHKRNNTTSMQEDQYLPHNDGFVAVSPFQLSRYLLWHKALVRGNWEQ